MIWDVCNGVARRAWAGGKNAQWNIKKEMARFPGLKVTTRFDSEEETLNKIFE